MFGYMFRNMFCTTGQVSTVHDVVLVELQNTLQQYIIYLKDRPGRPFPPAAVEPNDGIVNENIGDENIQVYMT